MLLKTPCPQCQIILRCPAERVGTMARCPACNHKFRITTTSSGLAASTAAEPSMEVGRTVDSDGSRMSGEGVRSGGSTMSGEHNTEPGRRKSIANQPSLGRLGHYDLKAILGSGGFGVVYHAWDTQLGRPVAVKVPRFDTTADRKVRRFRQEARAAAKLQHPGIVGVIAEGLEDNKPYIVTEFIDGQPLSVRIAKQQIERRQAIGWIRDLAVALEYAHEQGVIHRDIKPDNIMLDVRGRPKIMDFGLARQLDEDSSLSIDGSVLGTPSYMAPEQARGEISLVDARSDQYSLGAMLYEILTGQKTFSGSPHAVLAKVADPKHEPPSLRSLDASIPKDLEAICQRAISKRKEDRYADMQSFADDLERWLQCKPTDARPLARHEQAIRWCNRNPWQAISGAAVTAASLVTLLLAWSVLQRDPATPLAEIPPDRVANEVAQVTSGASPFKRQPLLHADDLIAARRIKGGWSSSWSPDGKKLIRHDDRTDLLKIVDLDTGNETELCQGGDPVWSPGANGLIAFVRVRGGERGTREIWFTDTKGTDSRYVTDGLFPGWSGDGKRIYFFQSVGGASTLSSLVVDDAAAKPVQIMSCPSAWPSVSPNERFVSVHQNARTPSGMLVVIEIATQAEILKHPLPSWPGMLGRWSPDSRYLSWGSFGENRGLWMLDIQTRQVWLVAQGPFTLPAWSPDGLQMAVDDRGRQEVLILDATKLLSPPVSSAIERNSLGMGFIRVEPGEFLMGASQEEPEPIRGTETQHRVKLTRPFMMSEMEVTQGQWKAMMQSSPWVGQRQAPSGDGYPATYNSWDDAAAFCQALAKKEKRAYRLPTEAEWEYACRAGTTSAYSCGNDIEELSDYAWIRINSSDQPGLVGRKKPNAWGFFDMPGNVGEWCSDWYSDLSAESATDPQGPRNGTHKILRGGGYWALDYSHYRSASRRPVAPPYRGEAERGFRVVLEPLE